MITQVINKQKLVPISAKQVKALANAVVFFEKKQYDEVAIYFINKRMSSSIHRTYFGDPSPTDCMSFPLTVEAIQAPYRMLGDLFVCPEVALEYAAKHKRDPAEELSLYIVHGLLHLMGYDDIAPEERRKMRAAERRQMRNLKQMNCLLT